MPQSYLFILIIYQIKSGLEMTKQFACNSSFHLDFARIYV